MTTSEAAAEQLVELGFYGLAGHSDSPADLFTELDDAERIGLGSTFLSERFNVKEAGALTGVAVGATRQLGVATGVTNHFTRHPMVTAAWATTLHRISGGRFALGLGRGIAPLTQALGFPPVTMAQIEDAIGILRRLWRGEMILGHDGPAGRFPFLRLDPAFDEDIPVMVSALGEKTMRWAGGVAEGVILHTFFSDEALARCVRAVREGAEAAGRDPARVRVWAVVAVVPDTYDEDERLMMLVGRMATYLQVYGDALVTINGWDPAILERFRADPVVAGIGGAIDAVATTEQLTHIAALIPDEWLPAATGGPEACARRLVDQFDVGADGVIAHAADPAHLAPVVDAYRTIRPADCFTDRVANPGR